MKRTLAAIIAAARAAAVIVARLTTILTGPAVAAERTACQAICTKRAKLLEEIAAALDRHPTESPAWWHEGAEERRRQAELLRLAATAMARPDHDLDELERERFGQTAAEHQSDPADPREDCEYCGSPQHTIAECRERALDERARDLAADPGDMDGDHATGLASAGFGTDEDYGLFDNGD